jgi:tape measure domain-containing protein
MNNILEFFVKMKDMMSGGLSKLAENSRKTFNQVQDNIDKTVRKNKELGDSFEKVSAKAKGSGSNMTGMLKGLGVAAAAATVAFAALNFGKDAVGKAMEFGKTKQSFTVLTGSKEKGEGLTNELNSLQQKTILGPEVFKSAQTMLGFGIQAEKVVPTLKRLGDISMGDAQKMESLTLAFSQISSAGKLSGQDLLQMINAGYNPLNEISKKTGVSIGDLKKQMEAGGISAKMVEDSLISATSAGGQFYGMMNTLAETPAGKLAQLEGAFENFETKAGEALMPIATVLMDMASPLLDLATQYLPMVAEGVNYILGLVTGTKQDIGGWSDYISMFKDYMMVVWDGLKHVFGVVAHILGGVIEWMRKSEILKDAFAGLYKFGMFLWEVLKKVADLLGWLWDNVVKPILDALETAYKWIKSLLGGDEVDVNVKLNKDGASVTSTVPQDANTNTSSLTATQVPEKSTGGASGSFDPVKSDNQVAKGITGGGPRVINITIGKMVEKIEMNVGSMQEGMTNMEQQVEEMFLRVLYSGGKFQK